jgi:transcriptional regulator with GAF, ATPase, and Fis domain
LEAVRAVRDYTNDLHTLAAMVAEPGATPEVLDRALAAMRAVVPYDLAAVFRLCGDELRVVAAAGPLAGPEIRAHSLALSRFPTVRRALELRRPIPLEEHDHAGDEGDPFDGVLELPHGHSCMVVPLFAGDRSLGLITFDRQACGVYPPQAVEIAGVYGQLVSLALLFADQSLLLDRYRHQLREQNRLLTEDVGGADLACRRLDASTSPAMKRLARMARQVAVSNLPVLVLGETGTGKEVLAQAIHAWSPRLDGPFVKLNCSAIPENLVESELFGHVRGAFSGAERPRRGRFLTANGGTLLLDEIGDMPLAAQAKLLRVLQEGTFEPVGSDETARVDVRVIAATHVDLERAVAEGRFREDLYYRLAVFPLTLPPLRERPEDIPVIALAALDDEHRRSRRGPWALSEAALAALTDAPWPGNIRQLLNALERATILRPAGELTPTELGLAGPVAPAARQPATGPAAAPLTEAPLPSYRESERRYLERLLEQTGGKIYGDDGAAALAQLKPTTLQSKLKKLGLR